MCFYNKQKSTILKICCNSILDKLHDEYDIKFNTKFNIQYVQVEIHRLLRYVHNICIIYTLLRLHVKIVK